MGKGVTLSISLVLVHTVLAASLFLTLFLLVDIDILESFAQEDEYPVTVTNETQQQALKNRFSAQSNMIETTQSINGSIKTTEIGNLTNISASSQQGLVRAITEDIKKQLQTNIDKNTDNKTTVQIIDQVTGQVIRTQIKSVNDTALTEAITKWLQKGPPPDPDYTTDNSSTTRSSTVTPGILTREKIVTSDNLLNLVQFAPYYQQICDLRISYWQPHYYGEWHQLGPGNWIYDIHWYWHYHCNGYD